MLLLGQCYSSSRHVKEVQWNCVWERKDTETITYMCQGRSAYVSHRERPDEWHEISAECFSGMWLWETRNWSFKASQEHPAFSQQGRWSTWIFSTFLFKLKPAQIGVSAQQWEISWNGFGMLMKSSQHPVGFKHLQQLFISSGPSSCNVFTPFHVPACSEPH